MEHKVSHGSTRKSATNPRTSSTREWRKMRDNTLGEPILRKEDHGKGQDGGRKLLVLRVYLPPLY